MKVWLWTSHIGEDENLTYSNHRHSQVTVITNYNRKYDGTWGSLATAACGGKREQSAVWNKEHKVVHLCTTQGDYISDGGESDRKIKTDIRKQLFLGRALMTVWLWTGRIGEDESLTYSNHRHSQVTVISNCNREYDGPCFFNHTIFCKSVGALIGRPQVK